MTTECKQKPQEFHAEIEILRDEDQYLDPRGELLSGSRLRGRLNSFHQDDVADWWRTRETWPCPVCGDHGEECRVSPAGTYIVCDRRSGGWGVVWDVTGDIYEASLYPVASRVGLILGGGRLLLAKHLTELRASGLSDEAIRQAGLYSEAEPERIKAILGWRKMTFFLGPVLVIPYRDAEGQDTGYNRVKPDKPRADDEGRERKYEAPRLRPNRAYFPPGTLAALRDPSQPLLVTEGEKKALKADQDGFPCVGLSGVWNWVKKRPEDEAGRKTGPRQMIDDLAAVAWKGRPVYIAFDSDSVSNENVREAEFALAVELMKLGAVVKVVLLPDGLAGDDGEPLKVGLDDFLLAHSPDELRELIADAVEPSEIEPREGRPVEPFKDPHRLAKGFLKARQRHRAGPGVHFWEDEWRFWDGRQYMAVPDSVVNAGVTAYAKEEFDKQNVAAGRKWRADVRVYETQAAADKAKGRKTEMKKPSETPPTVAPVTTAVVGNTTQAMRSMTHLPPDIRPPAWVGGDGPFPAGEVLVFGNGLLHWPGFLAGKPDAFVRHTPAFFGGRAVGFDFSPAAPAPQAWLKFVGDLFPGDPESIDALREVFGYLLTNDTRQQKIIALVGPKRGGKGTIARVLAGLVGEESVAGPTLASLGTEFGLAPLLDKKLGVIADARLSNSRDVTFLVERLLAISGEDAITVNRKHKAQVTVRLPVRLLVLSNELPQLDDASGAVASRFILFRLTQSWYGKEDPFLMEKLQAELPGILMWSLEGLRRLGEKWRLTQPTAAAQLVEEMQTLSSPLTEFVETYCVVGPGLTVDVPELFGVWKAWAGSRNLKEVIWNEPQFGKYLGAAVPSLDRKQRRLPNSTVTLFPLVAPALGVACRAGVETDRSAGASDRCAPPRYAAARG